MADLQQLVEPMNYYRNKYYIWKRTARDAKKQGNMLFWSTAMQRCKEYKRLLTFSAFAVHYALFINGKTNVLPVERGLKNV